MLDVLLSDDPLPAHALLLYFVLRELPGPEGSETTDPWTTYHLSLLARMSRASVFRALKILEKRSLIERKRAGRDANTYRVAGDAERRAAMLASKH